MVGKQHVERRAAETGLAFIETAWAGGACGLSEGLWFTAHVAKRAVVGQDVYLTARARSQGPGKIDVAHGQF